MALSVIVLVLGFALSGYAEEAPEDPTPSGNWREETTPRKELNLFGVLLRLSVSLILVVLLAWGVIYVLKRATRGQVGAMEDRALQVLERTSVAPKKAIYLVRVGERVIAVGVTEAQINFLCECPLEEIHAARLAQDEKRTSSDGRNGFKAALNSIMSLCV